MGIACRWRIEPSSEKATAGNMRQRGGEGQGREIQRECEANGA